MKRLFLVFFCMVLGVENALSSVFDGNRVVYDDLFIDVDEIYSPDSLTVYKSINIENNGLLETRIIVHDNVQLRLENHSVLDSVFVLGKDAGVIQYISDVDDMNRIDFNVPYSVMVDGVNMLKLSEVIDFASGADKIILADSWFDINDMNGGNIVNVELRGDVFLYAVNVDGLYGVPFIMDVQGDGNIHLITDKTDVLFTDVAILDGGILYFERQRELDYEKIFRDDMVLYLNSLRINNPNDKLLYALDSVVDMDSFNCVLKHSVRFNDDMLLRPLRILNALNVPKYFEGVLAGGWTVLSDDFYSYGLNATLAENILSGLTIGADVSLGRIEYEGMYDTYSGDLLGLDFFAVWNMDKGFVLRGLGGVLYEGVKIGEVFYDERVYENPNVFLGYVQSDIGYNYNLSDSFKLNVYLGARTEAYSVADMSNGNLNLYSGLNVKYEFETVGIKYDYSVGIDVNTDSDVVLNAGVGFVSEMDMVGGNVNFSALRMFDVMTYKISLGVRLFF